MLPGQGEPVVNERADRSRPARYGEIWANAASSRCSWSADRESGSPSPRRQQVQRSPSATPSTPIFSAAPATMGSAHSGHNHVARLVTASSPACAVSVRWSTIPSRIPPNQMRASRCHRHGRVCQRRSRRPAAPRKGCRVAQFGQCRAAGNSGSPQVLHGTRRVWRAVRLAPLAIVQRAKMTKTTNAIINMVTASGRRRPQRSRLAAPDRRAAARRDRTAGTYRAPG
jgi:hypothetical protein